MTDFDALAVDALLDPNPKRRAKRMAALKAAAECRAACPDCGHEGPHDAHTHMGQREFACTGCGLQFVAPEIAS
jgi:NAD-dependent dihydropyrimidine dehydrogenase PreA subunit